MLAQVETRELSPRPIAMLTITLEPPMKLSPQLSEIQLVMATENVYVSVVKVMTKPSYFLIFCR